MTDFVCPHCGKPIILDVTAKKVAVEISKVSEKQVKAVFGRGIEILELDDCFVEFSLTGPYNRGKFNKTLTEVKGYCGQFVKGRFRVPLASLGMLEK